MPSYYRLSARSFIAIYNPDRAQW